MWGTLITTLHKMLIDSLTKSLTLYHVLFSVQYWLYTIQFSEVIKNIKKRTGNK